MAYVKGYEHDTIRKSDKMGKMTFDEWLIAKPKPDPITKQRDIENAMKGKYIKEYREG